MNIHELSGDSRVENMSFNEGFITFIFEDYVSDRIFEIRIKTDVAFINYRLDEFAYEYCSIKKFNLSEHLLIDDKSKLYIMPSDFISQMKIARQKFNLAIGLNSTEWKEFIQVIGYGVIIACPVKSSDSVDIAEIGSLINIHPN